MKRLFAVLLLLLCTGHASARGLEFSETMRGYVYHEGEFREASVSLRVVIPDIDRWRGNLNLPAAVTGTLFIDRLPAQPIAGTLVILASAPTGDGRVLAYRFSGTSVQFTGFKHVRDSAGVEVFDAMTTLYGLMQPKGQPLPDFNALITGAQWSSEFHFDWWNPAVVWDFGASFQTIATPWYQTLEVQALFVRTMFGALGCTLFPWLC
ncbi:hypothetical protein [Aquabacterium humicola]|uniref:hypothetical protein n=1 Tax=Aquabacterium humicola TaxID=3237377 RepID=UPI00254332A8|nr:hypothetical protein [Rubrivivax pictus]